VRKTTHGFTFYHLNDLISKVVLLNQVARSKFSLLSRLYVKTANDYFNENTLMNFNLTVGKRIEIIVKNKKIK